MKNLKSERVGSLICYLLRHNPMGLDMDCFGYVNIDDMINKISSDKGYDLSSEIIKEINSDNRRYRVNGNYVKAKYGHSLDIKSREWRYIDLDNTVLYHGTGYKNLYGILNDGIQPMDRKYAHVSYIKDIAEKNSYRHSKYDIPVVLTINGKKLRNNVLDCGDGIAVSEKIDAESIENIELKPCLNLYKLIMCVAIIRINNPNNFCSLSKIETYIKYRYEYMMSNIWVKFDKENEVYNVYPKPMKGNSRIISEWGDLETLKNDYISIDVDYEYGSGYIKYRNKRLMYLSTHTLYKSRVKDTEDILRCYGFNVKVVGY